METLKEFIDEHFDTYIGIRLYITTEKMEDEFSFEDLKDEDYKYLNDLTIIEWTYNDGTFYFTLNGR